MNEYARNEDPETSHIAVPAAQRRLATKKIMLFAHCEALRHHSQLRPYQGFTDYEIMEACEFDLADDGLRRRHGDLRAEGLLTFGVSPETFGPNVLIKRKSAHSGAARAVSFITQVGLSRAIEWGF